jgi:hypothetical protein
MQIYDPRRISKTASRFGAGPDPLDTLCLNRNCFGRGLGGIHSDDARVDENQIGIGTPLREIRGRRLNQNQEQDRELDSESGVPPVHQEGQYTQATTQLLRVECVVALVRECGAS